MTISSARFSEDAGEPHGGGRMRFLVIRFSSLGDVVLATSVLEALRHSVPGAVIDLAVKEEYADLFRGDQRVRNLFLWKKGQGFFPYVRQLRRQKYDWVFDLHQVLRSFLLFPFVRRSRWIGCRKRSLRRRLYVRYRIHRNGWVRPLQEAYREVLGRAGFATDRFSPRLVPAPENIQYVDNLFHTFGFDNHRPILAIAPGARRDVRRWPEERFGEIGRMAAEELGAHVLVVGEEREREILSRVVGVSGEGRARLAAGLSLNQLSAVLSRSDLLLGNDSGPAHVARAVGTPAGVIYGPTSAEFFPPVGSRDFAVQKALPCRPCSLRGERTCSRERRACLEDISPDDVFPEIRNVLSLKII